jgi:3-dehydroquinate synthase
MTSPSWQTLTLDLGARSYPIHIGTQVMAHAGALLVDVLPSKRAIIITDSNVAALHLSALETALTAGGFSHHHLILPAGEATKSFSHFEDLLGNILALHPDRKTALIALGGGVIGDITGFAASVLLRGMPFVQIPTTLLSQVDSSVGGKTAINSPHGKNLIGAFYQPKAVLADIDTLKTLPKRELLAGYAEVVKYGVIDHPEFFTWLEANGTKILTHDVDAVTHAVYASCEAKARIVQADEHESDVRALLNLGHTFGHALEKATGYSAQLLHGEAVALGTLMALHASVARGICPQADFERFEAHLTTMEMPTRLTQIRPEWDCAALTSYCYHDKKAEAGNLTFILTRGIGGAFICKDMTAAEVQSSFEALR